MTPSLIKSRLLLCPSSCAKVIRRSGWRRARKHVPMKAAETITEESIRLLVHTFYDGVRRDAVLGPVFDKALHGDWEGHLPRMVDFWSTVLLGTSRFQGNVYGKHMALQGIEGEHFVRWLSLFKQTVTRLFAEPAAGEILLVADRIAGSLQLGYFGERRVAMP